MKTTMGKKAAQDHDLRSVWLAILLLTGSLAATVAGVTFHLAAGDVRVTLGAAAAAFVGVVTLGLAIWQKLEQ